MNRTFIIAEAGVNHNGDLALARRLVEVAAEAGADAVKFQTFRSEELVTEDTQKADYQKKTTSGEATQLEMLKRLELPYEAHFELRDLAQRLGIEFLSTPFDFGSVDFLAGTLGLERLKLPSGEITNGPLLLKAARTGKKLILSTGMSDLGEIREALGVLAFGLTGNSGRPGREAFAQAFRSEAGRAALEENVVVLHCTSEYPAPFREMNLRAMRTIGETFGLPVGLSDHSVGITVPIGAVALGAEVIEKHFTLDRKMPGPDHSASLEPDELKDMVRSIREIEESLGVADKGPTASETRNRPAIRRSLIFTRDVSVGETLTEENLGAKRPGNGLSPMEFWDHLGRAVTKPAKRNERLPS
jgi:N-acetylneuraminate synthase